MEHYDIEQYDIDRSELLNSLDQTMLRVDVGQSFYEDWIKKNAQVGYKSLCIPPSMVEITKKILEETNSNSRVCTVIGFPNGYSDVKTKIFEANHAAIQGADEIDIVMNLQQFLSGMYKKTVQDLVQINRGFQEGRETKGNVKVIIETGYLNSCEIATASILVAESGADYVKTSTGFGKRGCTLEDIILIKKSIPATLKIKASGGISNYAFAKQLLDAGARRLGTSHGTELLQQLNTSYK